MKSYYDILGVSRSASVDDLKKAYRKLAMQYHPDVNKTPGADKTFREINEAYAVLSDAGKRRQYDFSGNAGSSGSQGYGGHGGGGRRTTFTDVNDVNEIFESFFGKGFGGFAGFQQGSTNGPRKGATIINQIKISFRDSYLGTSISLKINGKSESINIPAGVENGMELRLRGKGRSGSDGGPNGDLILKVVVIEDDYFERKNEDLYIKMPISFTKLIMGMKVDLPIYGKVVNFTIPEMTDPNKTLRIKDKGFPFVNKPNKRGDLYVKFDVIIPKKLSKQAWKELETLSQSLDTRETDDFLKDLSRQ